MGKNGFQSNRRKICIFQNIYLKWFWEKINNNGKNICRINLDTRHQDGIHVILRWSYRWQLYYVNNLFRCFIFKAYGHLKRAKEDDNLDEKEDFILDLSWKTINNKSQGSSLKGNGKFPKYGSQEDIS